MSTPQDPPVRKKQKVRRAKKLAAWRAKKELATQGAPTSDTKATESKAKSAPKAKAETKTEKTKK